MRAFPPPLRYGVASLLILCALSALPAYAGHRHHHRHHVHHEASRSGISSHPQRWEWSYGDVGLRGGSLHGRPSDCYGIPWCGCYLRHLLGIADRELNRAVAWAHWGHATYAHAGAVAVWRHHVGIIRGGPDQTGRWLVESGNDGHAVRTRYRSLARAIAFRE
jgi:hypothetical protein